MGLLALAITVAASVAQRRGHQEALPGYRGDVRPSRTADIPGAPRPVESPPHDAAAAAPETAELDASDHVDGLTVRPGLRG